jgi:nicotinamidase-related amidase
LDKFTLAKEDTVLMIIDIQERLSAAMKYGKDVIDNTDTLITISKDLGIPILATEQYPKGLGDTVERLKPNLEKDSVYEKIVFSGYIEQVASALKRLERKKVVIVGMEAHVCVFQTVRDLLSDGYQVFVVADAVCSRIKQNYKIALDPASSITSMALSGKYLSVIYLSESFAAASITSSDILTL